MRRALFFTAVALAFAPTVALATERQHHLGFGPTGSLLKARNHALSPGLGVSALYTYGLTDQFNLLGELSQQFFDTGTSGAAPAAPFIRPSSVSTGAVGVAYVLDVLRWVPYGGVLLSGDILGGGTLPHVLVLPDAQVAVGLDYQFTRHFVAGVGFRQHFLFTKLTSYPSFSSLFAKAEWQWGY